MNLTHNEYKWIDGSWYKTGGTAVINDGRRLYLPNSKMLNPENILGFYMAYTTDTRLMEQKVILKVTDDNDPNHTIGVGVAYNCLPGHDDEPQTVHGSLWVHTPESLIEISGIDYSPDCIMTLISLDVSMDFTSRANGTEIFGYTNCGFVEADPDNVERNGTENFRILPFHVRPSNYCGRTTIGIRKDASYFRGSALLTQKVNNILVNGEPKPFSAVINPGWMNNVEPMVYSPV